EICRVLVVTSLLLAPRDSFKYLIHVGIDINKEVWKTHLGFQVAEDGGISAQTIKRFLINSVTKLRAICENQSTSCGRKDIALQVQLLVPCISSYYGLSSECCPSLARV